MPKRPARDDVQILRPARNGAEPNGTEAPRRLAGDDLYTWAQLVAAVTNAIGQMQAYGREVGPKYGIRPGEVIDNAGYIVPNPQGEPPTVVPPRVETSGEG